MTNEELEQRVAELAERLDSDPTRRRAVIAEAMRALAWHVCTDAMRLTVDSRPHEVFYSIEAMRDELTSETSSPLPT